MSGPIRSPRGSDEDQPESPEALLISALIEQGRFVPDRYSVTDDDVAGWQKLWTFCREYQERAGSAPPIQLVEAKFPDFSFFPDIDPTWAASKLLDASAARQMRLGIRDALASLRDESLPEAYNALGTIPKPRVHAREAADVFDHSVTEDNFDISKIPVPWPTLARFTGGIGPAELWWVAARWAQGKSWLLLEMAAMAAESGYKVSILSYEMPVLQVTKRLHKMMARHDRNLFAMIRGGDPLEYKKAIDILKDRVPGSVRIMDSSYGPISSVNYVPQVAYDCDLVILDHVGLMRDHLGHRAGDDWRYHQAVSNVLKETTLETSTPIVGAVQVNREGEKGHSTTPPGGVTLSGTDALGQDADVLLMHRRASERVMVHMLEKNREGSDKVKFWSEFNPTRNRWQEIDHGKASELITEDGGARDE